MFGKLYNLLYVGVSVLRDQSKPGLVVWTHLGLSVMRMAGHCFASVPDHLHSLRMYEMLLPRNPGQLRLLLPSQPKWKGGVCKVKAALMMVWQIL